MFNFSSIYRPTIQPDDDFDRFVGKLEFKLIYDN